MTERPALRLKEGWHVLHLFYRVQFGHWEVLASDRRSAAKMKLSVLVQEIRSLPFTQILTFSIISPKADIGFMLLTDDLHIANSIEKKLSLSLGADILAPVFSYYSVTERSEYTTSEEEYATSLVTKVGLSPESSEFTKAILEFRQRMQKYSRDRLFPNMPDWPVVCFYPMTKRKAAAQNWYLLPFEKRKDLMLGHSSIGRRYAGRIRQLITGSTGLDDAEWGITLFAHDVFEIKSIVYEMRFDAVSAQYADFGQFYLGLQLPLDDLFQRIQL
jgi:peroxiredoxin